MEPSSHTPPEAKAQDARARLENYFKDRFPNNRLWAGKFSNNRILFVVRTYRDLSASAKESGLTGESAALFVKGGLVRRMLIDTSDPGKTDEAFGVFSEGYELNRDFWDDKLAEQDRFFGDD